MARARIVTDHTEYSDSLVRDLRSRGFEVQTSSLSDPQPEEPVELEIRMRRCMEDDLPVFADTSQSAADVSIVLTPQALSGEIRSVDFYVLAKEVPEPAQEPVTEISEVISPVIEDAELDLSADDLVPHGLIWQAIASQQNTGESATRGVPVPKQTKPLPVREKRSRPSLRLPRIPYERWKAWAVLAAAVTARSFRSLETLAARLERRLAPQDRTFARAVGLAIVVAVIAALAIPAMRDGHPIATAPAATVTPAPAVAPQELPAHGSEVAESATRHSSFANSRLTVPRAKAVSVKSVSKPMATDDGGYVAQDTVTTFPTSRQKVPQKHQDGVQYFSDLR